MSVFADGIAAVKREGCLVVRYRVAGGVREVYSLWLDRDLVAVDVPADAAGQLFTVDGCWQDRAALEAFLKEYAELGESIGCCPVFLALEADLFEDAEVDEAFLRGGVGWPS